MTRVCVHIVRHALVLISLLVDAGLSFAAAQMKLDATYTPVACDERMLRIILTGKDMRTGDELKGGPLASRVPKA